jgi:hypothetical protein
MGAMPDFHQLQLRFVDHVHWRYELIRPVVLVENRTAAQRAEETHTHPKTVRHLTRRFRQQGTLGLFPEHTKIISPTQGKAVSDAVVEELAHLKALYDGFGYCELARILWHKVHERTDDKRSNGSGSNVPLPCKASCPLAAITATPIAIKRASRSSNSTIKAGISAASVIL